MILFVDDDVTKRYACCRPLRKEGFSVVEASSGAEALATLPRLRPDVLICDARLSDMDGYELCKRAKALLNIPVLLVSSKPKDAELARQVGVDAYVDDYGISDKFVQIVRTWMTSKQTGSTRA